MAKSKPNLIDKIIMFCGCGIFFSMVAQVVKLEGIPFYILGVGCPLIIFVYLLCQKES